MTETYYSMVELEFTDGIEVIFNTKISKIVEGSHESLVTVYNSTSSILTFPDNGLDTPDTSRYGSVTLHTYPLPMNSFFYARAYRKESEPGRPVSSIYTNPYFKGDGLGSMSILKHLQNTVGIENAYTLSLMTADGIEEFAQTLLKVGRVCKAL